MIIPPYLEVGDSIRIVSPAGKVDKAKIQSGIELLKEEGFEVLLSDHVLGKHYQFSGSDKQRLDDLQDALDDKNCKAIVCARGGYGTLRIVDSLNLSSLQNNPKWLVGFSDITVLHCLFQSQGIASIHGAMPGSYLKDNHSTKSFTQLLQVLKGEKLSFDLSTQNNNRNGEANGQLTGGNLSLLYSLLGTPFEPKTEGKILFIEDLSEYLYHLDRMMHSLKLAGKLKNLAGLVVGSFTEMKDNESPFGQTIEEIILDVVKNYNFPVCFDFPAGHIDQNLPLVLGAEYELRVGEEVHLTMQ